MSSGQSAREHLALRPASSRAEPESLRHLESEQLSSRAAPESPRHLESEQVSSRREPESPQHLQTGPVLSRLELTLRSRPDSVPARGRPEPESVQRAEPGTA